MAYGPTRPARWPPPRGAGAAVRDLLPRAAAHLPHLALLHICNNVPVCNAPAKTTHALPLLRAALFPATLGCLVPCHPQAALDPSSPGGIRTEGEEQLCWYAFLNRPRDWRPEPGADEAARLQAAFGGMAAPVPQMCAALGSVSHLWLWVGGVYGVLGLVNVNRGALGAFSGPCQRAARCLLRWSCMLNLTAVYGWCQHSARTVCLTSDNDRCVAVQARSIVLTAAPQPLQRLNRSTPCT